MRLRPAPLGHMWKFLEASAAISVWVNHMEIIEIFKKCNCIMYITVNFPFTKMTMLYLLGQVF